MTIIKQIKAEIERRLKKYATDVTMPLDELGKVVLELKGVLSFLSTLESEKPMNQKGLEREIERCLWQLTDDPSNDELRMFARHFAEWGAEHAREHMMKEAVEADVMLTLHDKTGDISLHTGYLPKELGIKCDDKVRVIIVKED